MTTKRKRLTPKQMVQAAYPHAICTKWVSGFIVTAVQSTSGYLGKGQSPRQAWADAAKRLERRTK